MIDKLTYIIKVFYKELVGVVDYWHPNLKSREIDDVKLMKLYYLDFSEKGVYPFKLENGLPVLHMNGKKVFFSITILNYGLGLLENYVNGIDNKNKINIVLDWALKNQCKDGSWKNYYDVPEHNMKSGWTSSMGQGLGISFIFRAYNLGFIQKKDALRIINSAYKFILQPEMRNYITNEDYIFQEFSGTTHSVLNGYIFTIYGLYDYYLLTGNKIEFNNCIKVLKKHLKKYTVFPGWSYYSLSKIISSNFYHKLHVEMLFSLFFITNDKYFLTTANYWNKGKSFRLFFLIVKSFQKLLQFQTINKLPS